MTLTEPGGGSSPLRRSKAQKGTPEIRIKVSWCKGCGLCVDYCKTDVLVMEGVLPKVVQAERCNWCLQCEAICPDFAIEVGDPVAASQAVAASQTVAASQAVEGGVGTGRASGGGGRQG